MWKHACHSSADTNRLTTRNKDTHVSSILCQSDSKKKRVGVMRNCLTAHNGGSLKITPTHTHKIHIICDLFVFGCWIRRLIDCWPSCSLAGFYCWYWCLSAKSQLWLLFSFVSPTKLEQTLISVIADPLQLRIHTTAVGPAGLIEVLDYQWGLAGEERLKGHDFCFTFVIALEWAWSHCRLLLSWKTGTRCTNRCTYQYSWFIGYGSQMYTAKISTWQYPNKC